MRQRDKAGKFITNDFKNLQIEESTPTKRVPVTEIVVPIMAIIIGLLVADYMGWIDIVKLLNP